MRSLAKIHKQVLAKRCKHQNGYILETVRAYSGYEITDGRITGDWSDADGPTGHVTFKCASCGLQRAYTYRNRPAWLARHMETIDAWAAKESGQV